MAKKRTAEQDPLEVNWMSEPLDVNVYRNGSKLPRRKVKVRSVVGDEWIEEKADLPDGAVRRLVSVIKLLAQHGYEARLDESIRFVHMYDKKQGLYLSPQLMQPFKDEVLKDVDFRLMFDDEEIHDIDEVRGTKAECGAGDGVTPDVMMTCEKCGHKQRVGRKRG